ncbi:hypothetical protein AeMF1_006255, partial [Aphanomyces euteiches]
MAEVELECAVYDEGTMLTVDMPEVELECALYAEGTMLTVKIARDAKVSALQEAIFDKKRYKERYSFDASNLTLYLAKKNDAWLKSDSALKPFLKRGRQITVEYVLEMIPNWKLDDKDYFGQKFKTGDKDIHVLVELPSLKYADPRLLELQESLLHHVLLDALTSTSARSNHFKSTLCATYDCNMGKGMLRCMLLDTALPSELVIASHLFRRKNQFLSEKLMGISDIDDAKNGLLLFKPLEHAFDHFQISFIYNHESDEFQLKIFDQSLRPQRLFGKLDSTQR